MADAALQDIVFPVACRHCAKQLHGEVRFCPYCGGEEAAFRAETVVAAAAAEPQHSRPGRAAEPMPQFDTGAAFAPRQALPPQAGFPAVLGPPDARGDGAEPEAVLLGPAAFEWPEGLPAVLTVEPRPPKPRLAALLARPVTIGSALALAVLALVLGPLLPDRQGEPARPQAAAKPGPASGAPGVARREAGLLAAAVPAPAAVPSLHDERERREREPLRDAGQRAAQALGLGDPSAAAPAAPPAAEAPPVAPPAAAVAAQAPTAACTEALAALALCGQDDAAAAPAR